MYLKLNLHCYYILHDLIKKRYWNDMPRKWKAWGEDSGARIECRNRVLRSLCLCFYLRTGTGFAGSSPLMQIPCPKNIACSESRIQWIYYWGNSSRYTDFKTSAKWIFINRIHVNGGLPVFSGVISFLKQSFGS